MQKFHLEISTQSGKAWIWAEFSTTS